MEDDSMHDGKKLLAQRDIGDVHLYHRLHERLRYNSPFLPTIQMLENGYIHELPSEVNEKFAVHM
jgi:hypothetical protein